MHYIYIYIYILPEGCKLCLVLNISKFIKCRFADC